MGGTRSLFDLTMTTLQQRQTHGCVPSIFGQCFYIFSELKEVEVLNYFQRYFISIFSTLLSGCCMATSTGFTYGEECCRTKGFKNPMSSQTPTSLLLVHQQNTSGFCALFLNTVELGYKKCPYQFILFVDDYHPDKIACTPPHQKSKEEIGDSL